MANDPAHFRPASWYFRQAVRSEVDLAQLREIALCLIEEIELLKRQVRQYGEILNRRYDVHAWLGHFEDERKLQLDLPPEAERRLPEQMIQLQHPLVLLLNQVAQIAQRGLKSNRQLLKLWLRVVHPVDPFLPEPLFDLLLSNRTDTDGVGRLMHQRRGSFKVIL